MKLKDYLKNFDNFTKEELNEIDTLHKLNLIDEYDFKYLQPGSVFEPFVQAELARVIEQGAWIFKTRRVRLDREGFRIWNQAKKDVKIYIREQKKAKKKDNNYLMIIKKMIVIDCLFDREEYDYFEKRNKLSTLIKRKIPSKMHTMDTDKFDDDSMDFFTMFLAADIISDGELDFNFHDDNTLKTAVGEDYSESFDTSSDDDYDDGDSDCDGDCD